MIWNPNGWNTLDMIIVMTEENAGADVTWMLPVIVGGPKHSVLLADDVIIERLERWETPTSMPTLSDPPSQTPTTFCGKNFVKNGELEEGTSSWFGYGNPIAIDDEPGFGGSGHALKAYNRNSWHRGIGQWLDFSCFSQNSTLHIQAKVKLYDQDSHTGITSCLPMNTLNDLCPMVRLLTRKSDGSHHWDILRDTNMNWNPNDWSDFDIKVKLTPDNSGDDIIHFRPFFVGGPKNSVLVIDNVQITLTDETDIEPTLPEPEYCRSTGDPHFRAFNGTRFDNHDIGWQTLYEMGKVKVEAEHALFKPRGRVMINRAWRVFYDGNIIEQGERGAAPSNDGVIVLYDPMVMIEITARDFRKYDWFVDEFLYNIWIMTPHYEYASGLCADKQVANEPPEFPEDPTVTIDVANIACANLIGTDLHDDCVADVRLFDDIEGIEDIVGVAAAANVAVIKVVATIQSLTKTDSASEAEDQLLVEEDQPEEVDRNVESAAENIVLDDDEDVIKTTRKLEVEVETEGDAFKESQSGVNGDPVIIGLQHQTFNFHGKNDTWYANVGTSIFQWNMKFHLFPECAGEDAMYVTSMAISIDKSRNGLSSNVGTNAIIISIIDENQAFTGCKTTGLCLGDGSLRINVNGNIYDEPGDYKISNDLRIVAHNTWEACSRKWYDYDEAMLKRDKEEYTARRLGRTPWRFGHKTRRLDRMMEKDPINFVMDARENMVAPLRCGEWIQNRMHNNDLFLQQGGWSTIYIETPKASFQVEYRQIQRDTEEIRHGGGSGGPEDLIIEGILFQGDAQKCTSHVLDAWLTHSAPEVRQEEWNGILGETKTSKVNVDGTVVLENRNILLKGTDEDYEVGSPFSRDFVAKMMQ